MQFYGYSSRPPPSPAAAGLPETEFGSRSSARPPRPGARPAVYGPPGHRDCGMRGRTRQTFYSRRGRTRGPASRGPFHSVPLSPVLYCASRRLAAGRRPCAACRARAPPFQSGACPRLSGTEDPCQISPASAPRRAGDGTLRTAPQRAALFAPVRRRLGRTGERPAAALRHHALGAHPHHVPLNVGRSGPRAVWHGSVGVRPRNRPPLPSPISFRPCPGAGLPRRFGASGVSAGQT